jgi:hypothetical protein
MIKAIAAIAASLLACACSQSPASLQAEAEAAIRQQLRNPTAARFAAIRICPSGRGLSGAVLSPEFADTDGFGAFVYVDREAVLLRSETSRYPELLLICDGK